jgi:protein tyrosine phosphatase (PTP) superfamily phosphohydrolase (DUF442 family)
MIIDFKRLLQILTLVFASSAQMLAASTSAVTEPGAVEIWGEDTQVVRAGRLFLAGQPDSAALERAKSEGVSMIIDLRDASEHDWDEAAAAAALDLDFHRVPVNGRAETLEAGRMSEISAIVEAHPDKKILVHCSSGNRSSAWYAVYLAQYLDMSADEAIATAKSTEMMRKGLEDKTRAYLEQ